MSHTEAIHSWQLEILEPSSLHKMAPNGLKENHKHHKSSTKSSTEMTPFWRLALKELYVAHQMGNHGQK